MVDAARRRPMSGALMLAGALTALAGVAACGGGGGGSAPQEPMPPPPAAVLTISTSATQVSAGDGDVRLDAALQHAADPVYWSLAGPGSLSAISGMTLRYTPPPAGEQRVPATAVVTASSRDLVSSVRIAIRPSAGSPPPVPGTRWEVVLYPKHGITDLRLLNDRFFATTVLGGILNSTDGIVWTPRATPPGSLNAITFGHAGYLAVGQASVFRSSDGDTWVDAGSGADFDFYDVAAGNGRYVATGNGVLASSADGSSWTRADATPVGGSGGVAFGAGRFVAVDNGLFAYASQDGLQWTAAPLPQVGAANSVAFGNGRFVILGQERNLTSTDGLTWTALPAGPQGHRVRFAEDRFRLLTFNAAWASSDGIAWQSIYGHTVVAMVMGAVERAGRRVIADNYYGLTHRGPWTDWTQALPGPAAALQAGIEVDGQYYAVSENGNVLRSADARSWSVVGGPLQANLRGIAYGHGRFVAVSSSGPFALYTSADGRQWSGIDLGPGLPSLSAVTFANGTFVALGLFGEMFHSTDGVRWARSPVPMPFEITSVAYGNGRFVATAHGLVTSTDGVNWTRVPDSPGARAIAYGNAGFVAVGGDDDGAAVWTSADGLSWARRHTEPLPWLRTVVFGNGQYLAAGDKGTLLLSADGVTWQRRNSGIHPDFVAALAARGRFLAMGWGGALVMSEQ